MRQTTSARLIRVAITRHGEYFYAKSDDLPGLNVCAITEDQICTSVVTAVKVLFRQNRKMEVEVIPVTEDDDSFPHMTGICEQFAVRMAA